MANAETIMGLSSINVSIISAIVSIGSLAIASFLAWRTQFSPPNFVGSFSYVVLWRFDGGDKDKIGDEYIIPYIWLSNVGARPFLVGNIRLTIRPNKGAKFNLHPIHSVPLEAIESPNIFSNFELIRLGEAPFNGFSVSSSKQWKNINAFVISPEQRALLKGDIKVTFEVRKLDSNEYQPILTETIAFENKNEMDWMRWAGEGGPESTYYYRIE